MLLLLPQVRATQGTASAQLPRWSSASQVCSGAMRACQVHHQHHLRQQPLRGLQRAVRAEVEGHGTVLGHDARLGSTGLSSVALACMAQHGCTQYSSQHSRNSSSGISGSRCC
jgi:hypothetical protein